MVGEAGLADGRSRAFLWEDGLMRNLGTLGGNDSGATALNDHGHVVGYSTLPNGLRHAFLWQEGALLDLGAPADATHSAAYGINGSGQIVGQATAADGRTSAFLRQNGSMVRLETLGGDSSSARGISGAGQVAGEAGLPNATRHAVLWPPGGGPMDLGTLGGVFSRATAINSGGWAAGYSQINGDPLHAVLFSSGQRIDLGTLGGADSQALALDDAGQVVGQAETADGRTHAFLWSRDLGMVDLNSLLPPNSGWSELTAATGINAAGQIVGFGTRAGQTRAFLLSPPASSIPTATPTATALDEQRLPLHAGWNWISFAVAPVRLGLAPTPTGYFAEIWGTASLNGVPLPVGAVVEAYSPRGDLAGTTTVRAPGSFGYMRVYGEDATASPPIPGMRAGETIGFRVNGYPVGTTSSPTVWQNAPDPVRADLLAISGQPVGADLATITGQFDYLLGEAGTYAAPPAAGHLNTLWTLEAGKGYFIRMKQAGELVLRGKRLPAETPLPTTRGWHWIGYLPAVGQGLPCALGSLAGSFDFLLGETGAHGVPPAPQFLNTLGSMQPGKGYLIRMTWDDVLVYNPDPLACSTATPTAAPAATSTAAPAATSTPATPPTATATPTAAPPPAATATPTAPAPPTATGTPIASPAPTGTPTAAPTSTATAAPPPTGTPTAATPPPPTGTPTAAASPATPMGTPPAGTATAAATPTPLPTPQG